MFFYNENHNQNQHAALIDRKQNIANLVTYTTCQETLDNWNTG